MSFNSSKLPNGLDVVTYSMEQVNSVAINIIVNVGSRYETEEEAGISHFLEHMAFKGTTNRTALEIAKEFDAIGGQFNAYTSREHTVYCTKVLSQHTDQALDMLSDILQNSLFEEGDIKKELGVILQEIAGVNDSPDDLVYERFYELAYPNQPIGKSILGTGENIAKFDKNAFQKYMAQHYRPDNIVISMAGKVTHEEAQAQVSKFFSNMGSSKQEPHMQTSHPLAQYVGGYHFTPKELEQTTIALGFSSVSYADLKLFYHAQILSIILGGGLSSRLFQRVREELGLAYSIGSWVNAFADSGTFSISAAADHNNIAVLLENIVIEVNKIKTDISEEELKLAKAQIETNIYMAEERSEYKSEEVGKNFALFRKYSPIEEVMDIVLSTTTDDLHAMAAEIFASNPTLSIVGAPQKDVSFNNIQDKLLK
ncbi:MAG: peptidase M16 [Rickettsiales bacterium]|nr:MAG: peptidase M16 [Rickettsiales bacterium]